jgi:hypothetical protein
VQTFHDACTSTYKDGKVVLAAQAEMDDELEEMQRRAHWVDITVGMEVSERKEYDAERTAQRLDPSDPRALNFNDEQSMKTHPRLRVPPTPSRSWNLWARQRICHPTMRWTLKSQTFSI